MVSLAGVSRHSVAYLGRSARGVCLVSLLACSGAALAGPCWEEPPISDAGPLPKNAQIPRGDTPLAMIQGSLSGADAALGEGDFQDMYLINIIDIAAFIANTSPEFGGAAEFPSSIWLFKADGKGLLANKGFLFKLPGAVLFPEANDDSGAALMEPGLYYLAIAGQTAQPLSESGPGGEGLAIFQFEDPLEISGPDGPGGAHPIGSWASSSPKTGTYSITLDGVAYPAPACRGDVNYDGVVDADDLGILLSAFGCSGGLCDADIDENGVVNADDLGILLANFGTECGPFGACCLPDGSCDFISIYACQEHEGVFLGDGVPCSMTACSSGPVSDCCSPNDGPGCEDPVCEANVCAVDPFCCKVEWDSICANLAQDLPECGCK